MHMHMYIYIHIYIYTHVLRPFLGADGMVRKAHSRQGHHHGLPEGVITSRTSGSVSRPVLSLPAERLTEAACLSDLFKRRTVSMEACKQLNNLCSTQGCPQPAELCRL